MRRGTAFCGCACMKKSSEQLKKLLYRFLLPMSGIFMVLILLFFLASGASSMDRKHHFGSAFCCGRHFADEPGVLCSEAESVFQGFHAFYLHRSGAFGHDLFFRVYEPV